MSISEHLLHIRERSQSWTGRPVLNLSDETLLESSGELATNLVDKKGDPVTIPLTEAELEILSEICSCGANTNNLVAIRVRDNQTIRHQVGNIFRKVRHASRFQVDCKDQLISVLMRIGSLSYEPTIPISREEELARRLIGYGVR